MLSLDGVAFVVLARELAAPGSLWTLGTLTTAWLLWCGYALDRTLDARWFPASTQTWRHRFHARHGWTFLAVGALTGGALFIALIWAGPDGEVPVGGRFFQGLDPQGAASGLVVIFCARWLTEVWALRIGLVALLLASFAASPMPNLSIAAYLAVFLLAATNLLAHRRIEAGLEASWDRFIPRVAAAGCLACLLLGSAEARWLCGACLVGILTLGWQPVSSEADPEYRRTSIDGGVLLVLAVVCLGRLF
jgi:amino acid transporter